MNGPNIFDYATSELSQDAFLCYLLAFGKEKYKMDFPKEYMLAHKFLAKCGIDEKEEILSVGQQVEHIDVLIITTSHILIIEDKTYTDEHDDQIIRYVKNMRKSEEKFLNDKKIKVCFLKTGDYVKSYSSSDESVLQNKDCCSLRRKNLLELLKDYYKCNLVFEMFYKRLLSVEEAIEQCDSENIFDWNRYKWFDFLYNTLIEKKKVFDIKWVHNPNGGFYGCWFGSHKLGEIEKYKQIEIHFNEKGTEFVDLCLKCSSESKEKTQKYKSDMEKWQKESGFNRPDRWRIGRTTTYATKQAINVRDIQNFIKK
ncbi:MAG: hypothetical protein E7021_01600 [Alphaproteobacteria bacterium]|nr:hypothetical protein [Alphaproteobacteria bacterium]